MMGDELVQLLRDCRKPPFAGDTTCKKCPFLYGSADGSEICLDRLIGAAADAIEELSKPRWIPVTERLPEDSGDYLVYDSCGNIFQNFFGTVVRRWSERDGIITHWMPLPDPPEEDTP